MQTFYMSCPPDQTQALIDYLSKKSGYTSLGLHPKRQETVFAAEFDDDIHGVFSLMRPLGAAVSQINPFEEKEKEKVPA